ncbi:MAG: hypothetical protein ACJ76P_01155 [Actinomycetota bacterium]
MLWIVIARREAKASGVKVVKVRGGFAVRTAIGSWEKQGYKLEHQQRTTTGATVLQFRRRT